MPAPVAGATAPGLGAEASAAADGPLGLFDALLQVAATLGISTETQASVTTEQQAALGAMIGQQMAATAATSTTIEAQPANLLGDLIDQLTVLSDALQQGAPIDTSLEARIVETLDALAAALGMPPTLAPDVDAALTATAAFQATAALDPLATIEAATSAALLPTAAPATDALPAGTVPPLVDATIDASVALPLAAATMADLDATIDADLQMQGAAPAAAETVELPVAVKALADKIAEMAVTLEAKSPVLAARLDALSKQIVAGELDIAALAELGLDVTAEPSETELAKAIERLLTPIAEGKPQSQVPFSTATLTLPNLFGPSDSKPAERSSPATASVAPKLDSEPDLDPRLAVETRSDGRADKPETTQSRPSFNAATQAHANAATPEAPPPTSSTAAANVGQQVAASVAADTKAIHAAYKAPVQQINMPQIAFEIVRQAEAGASRFQIRLDPPELGRVDVKLDVDKAGNVTARMTVERAETLDLMQRDQRSLERALAQAGLDSNKTNLEFSLRQNPFARDEHQQGRPGGETFPRFGIAEADEPAVPSPHILAYRGVASAGGVNLFV